MATTYSLEKEQTKKEEELTKKINLKRLCKKMDVEQRSTNPPTKNGKIL
jgi:hypothetical protein